MPATAVRAPAAAVDPRLFTSALPTRPKVSLRIEEETPGKTLDVTLSAPLDPACPDEAAALALAQDGRLDVRFTVTLNLGAERLALGKRLAEMYRSKLGEKLRADPPAALEPSELRSVLAPLARQGGSVFQRLFGKIQPRDQANYAELVRKAVRSILQRSQIIDIQSPEPLFPWALLYDRPDTLKATDLTSLEPERFWGFQHEIQERVEGTSPLLALPAHPSILTAVCSVVDAAGVHEAADHPLVTLGASPTLSTTADLGAALGAFGADCLYFYGHAFQEDPPVPSTSWLKLRGSELPVSEMEAVYHAPNFTRDPAVVFLNGCRTAPLSEWSEASVLGFLCGRGGGRLCCISSVAEVPEALAAEFARKFWQAFGVERRPIGEALLSARRSLLLRAPHSPLGLVYTLFGRADTQLATVAEKEEPHA